MWTPRTPDPASDCFEGPPAKSRCLSSVASDCSMSNGTVVTLGSVSGGDHRRHRKPGDCRRLWHFEWETAYLVRYDDKSNKCVCLKCNKTLEAVKKYTLQRHYESNQSDTKAWSTKKRELFVKQATKKIEEMQRSFVKTFNSNNLQQLAAYKLSHTLVKHHKPLSFGEAVVDWAKSCDKESKVFKNISKSTQSLTCRVSKMVDFIQEENRRNIRSSPCWGIQMDESTDKEALQRQ